MDNRVIYNLVLDCHVANAQILKNQEYLLQVGSTVPDITDPNTTRARLVQDTQDLLRQIKSSTEPR